MTDKSRTINSCVPNKFNVLCPFGPPPRRCGTMVPEEGAIGAKFLRNHVRITKSECHTLRKTATLGFVTLQGRRLFSYATILHRSLVSARRTPTMRMTPSPSGKTSRNSEWLRTTSRPARGRPVAMSADVGYLSVDFTRHGPEHARRLSRCGETPVRRSRFSI